MAPNKTSNDESNGGDNESESAVAFREFQRIPGVGKKTARGLIERGRTQFGDLLSEHPALGLTLHDIPNVGFGETQQKAEEYVINRAENDEINVDDDDKSEVVTDGGVNVREEEHILARLAKQSEEHRMEVAVSHEPNTIGYVDGEAINILAQTKTVGEGSGQECRSYVSGPYQVDHYIRSTTEGIKHYVEVETRRETDGDEPVVVTDGGVDVDDSHFSHTCKGKSADGTPCGRGVKGFEHMGHEEDNYCHDHEWQLGFVLERRPNLALVLPKHETVRIEVSETEVVNGEWGDRLKVTTQYGVAYLDSNSDVEGGCTYDMTAKTDPNDWRKIRLSITKVGDTDGR